MLKKQPMQNLRSRAQQLEIAKQRQAQNIAKAKALSTKPPSNIGPVNPIGTRGDSPPPIMLPPTGPTKPGYEPPPTGPMPAPIPDTPYIGENTGKKTATVGDEVYKTPTSSGAPLNPDAGKPNFEVMRNAPQPGPRAPVSAPAAPVDRGAPMSAPGGPVNVGGPSMGLGSTPPGSAQPSMGPAPTMRTPVRPTSPEQMMKKGGQAKAYASGGTVRGSGIAQRGVKKCKIY